MRALFVITLLAALVLPSGHASGSPPIDISAEELQTLHTYAAEGDARAQRILGALYRDGQGVPQDYAQAAYWFEKAAAQGDAWSQFVLRKLYAEGQGAFAVRWMDFEPPYGGAVMRIRLKCWANYQKNCN